MSIFAGPIGICNRISLKNMRIKFLIIRHTVPIAIGIVSASIENLNQVQVDGLRGGPEMNSGRIRTG